VVVAVVAARNKQTLRDICMPNVLSLMYISIVCVWGEFRMNLYALFSVYNGGARTVENNKIMTHLFNARKASLASRVPSFCSNISSK
jgi:hypothetical protein